MVFAQKLFPSSCSTSTVIKKTNSCSVGFTLTELLCVIAIIGILAAIVAPNGLRFLAVQQVDSAQGTLRQGIQQAQLKAQQTNTSWQFNVRERDNNVEMSTHPKAVSASSSNWEALDKSIQIETETSFYLNSGIYYVRFDEKGNVRASRLGRVTVSSKQFPSVKRCVFVSTLLGATRTAEGQSTPDDSGRFCY